jgi:hypothetical protein
MKKYKSFFTLILSLFFIPKLVLAQQDGIFDGSSRIIVSIFNLISIEITIPNIVRENVFIGPFWLLVLGFMIGFSVIYLAAAKIPLFRDAPSKGPLKMFTIAVSLMVIFSTPFLAGLLFLVGTFTSLTMIAVLVLGIYIIWTLFKGGWSEQSKDLANSNKVSAEAKEVNREAREISDNAKAGITALNRQKRALTRLLGKSRGGFWNRKGLVDMDIEHNKNLLKQLDHFSNVLGEASHVTGDRQKEMVRNALKELGNTISKLKSQTQTSVQRIGRIDRILNESEKEILDNAFAIDAKLIENINKVNDLNLDEKIKQDMITNLKDLKNKLESNTEKYKNKIENIRKLRKQLIDIDGLKMQTAEEINQALRSNMIPPDSAGHIQKLRNVIGQEIQLEAQLGEESSQIEALINALNSTEGRIKYIMNQESIDVRRHTGLARGH